MTTEIIVASTALQVGDAAIVNRAGAPASVVLGTASEKDLSYFNSATSVFLDVTTTYTLGLTDRSKTLLTTSATDFNITIPAELTIDFPIGSSLDIIQTAVGIPTINCTAGVSINKVVDATVVFSGSFGIVKLIKIAADSWIVAQ
jgi:hypothetical protein